MKKLKYVFTIVLMVLLSVFAVACDDEATPELPAETPVPPAAAATYTLSFASEDGAKGTVRAEKDGTAVTSGSSFEKDTQIKLIATANAGYTFSGWYVGDSSVATTAEYTHTLTADTTFTARFQINTYTLTFSSDDAVRGSVEAKDLRDAAVQSGTQFAHGTQIKLIATANVGYTFSGWYVGDTRISADREYTHELMADTTLVAKFSICRFFLDYSAQRGGVAYAEDGEGGSVADNSIHDYGEEITLIAVANTGYAFDGWYIAGQFVTADLEHVVTMTSDVRAEARFTQIEYTFNFSSESTQKGTVSAVCAGSRVNSGDSLGHGSRIALTATANDGYTFTGWYKGGSQVSTDASYTYELTADTTLTALFSTNRHTLTFAPEVIGQGTIVEASGILSEDEVSYGTSISLTVTPATGYNFAGWYEVDGDTPLETSLTYNFTMPSESVNVEARFTVQTRTVEFRDGRSYLTTQTVNYGARASYLYHSKDLHNLLGWYTDSTLTTLYNFDTPVTRNLTLYAKWQEVVPTYRVSFQNAEGERIGSEQVLEEGSLIIPIAPPQKVGYRFEAWMYFDTVTQTEQEYDASTTRVQADMVIRATYSVLTFNVTFCLDEASHLMHAGDDVQTVRFGECVTKPTTPTKNGYLFDYWKYGSARFDFSLPISNEDIVLYAVWKVAPLDTKTVTFYDEDGETVIDTQEIEVGASAEAPQAPVKIDKEFVGWDVAFTNVTQDLSVVARYETKTFKVVFQDYNGTVLKAEQVVSYNQAAVAPSAPTRTGYDFSGWDVSFTNVKEDLIVKATYAIKTFTVTFYYADGTQISRKTDVAYGTSIEIPETPTAQQSGYAFVNWYQESTLENVFSFATPIVKNVDLYAMFDVDRTQSFTVRFVQPVSGEVLSEQQVQYERSAIIPGTPSMEGYVFLYWDSTEYESVTRDLTITAVYEKIKYTVIFKDSLGNQIGTAKTVEHGDTAYSVAPQLAEIPLVTGKQFAGWDKDIITLQIVKDTQFVATYAWETRTVTFMIEDRQYVQDTVEYGSYVNFPSTPTAPIGYKFDGWYEEGSSTAFNFSTQTITQNTVLYAKFTQLVGMYTVTFYELDETTVFGNVQLVIEGKTATEPRPYTDGTATEYGWFIFNGETYERFDFTSAIQANVKLYARAL